MFALRAKDINISEAGLAMQNPKAGAYVSFEGWVRNHHEGKAVSHLEYEAYEALCHKEAEVVRQECLEQFEIYDLHCLHRTGKLEIGDIAVWVGVTAAHRGPAFAACEYYMNQLKVRVPIWKKETFVGGVSEWVRCEACAEHAH